MSVPEGFIGRPFKLSANITNLHIRRIGGGSRTVTGPLVTFEAEDDVDIHALLTAKAIAWHEEPRAHRARVTQDEESAETPATREGG